VAALGLLPAAARRSDLSSFRDTDAIAEAAYRFVPTDGVAITSYFETIFNLWYRQTAEARRPDVAVIHRLFRTYPGYDQALGRQAPGLAALFREPPPDPTLDTAWLTGHARRRAFLLEMDQTLQADLRPFLLPAGWWLWVSPTPIPGEPWPPSWCRPTAASGKN